MPGLRTARGVFASAALFVGSACAQVTIHAGDGSVTQDTRFGVVSIEPRPGTTAQIVELRAFGLSGQNGGLTLGYLSSTMAVLPADDCRVVVWVERAGAAPAAAVTKELLGGRTDICTVGPGAN